MSRVPSPLTGRAFVVGANVDTDVIIPARHLNTIEPGELAAHCLEPVLPGLAALTGGEGIIVAGENFGCGSSREHAPVALMAAGVRCVAAESLARIFYRNAVNTGLPVVVCPGVSGRTRHGDRLEIDLAAGSLRNATSGDTLSFEPLPSFMMGILQDGGLIPYLMARGLKFR